MTITLLMNSEGKKMGKTASGAVCGSTRTRQAPTTSTSIGATSATRMF